MKTFTYFQVGIPRSQEPQNMKHDLWRQGEFPLRRWVKLTLVETDRMIHHELRLTGPEIFTTKAGSILEADKKFEKAIGRHPCKNNGVESEPITVTITA